MREDNQTSAGQPPQGQTIDVKVIPAPQLASTESIERAHKPFIPTVEAAGDPPLGEAEPPTPEETEAHADEQSEPLAPEAKPDNDTPNNTPSHVEPGAHKAPSPVLAIVAAIVVALGLAAVTVYAYMQTQTKDDRKTNSSQSANTAASAEVKKEDVDRTAGEIDNALKATEETDFPESELTDSNLGL